MKSMLMVVAGAALSTALASSASQDPVPHAWPDVFFAIESKNGTTKFGEPKPFQASTKYYNWTMQALRQECLLDGYASTFLVHGTQAWVFNNANKACSAFKLPVTPVTPTWMLGGNYTGVQHIHGNPSHCWEKLNHVYCESIETTKPTRVFTPLDQKGYSNTEDYVVFMSNEGVTASDFDVPSFCNNAPPPKKGAGCPALPEDPACCFLPIA